MIFTLPRNWHLFAEEAETEADLPYGKEHEAMVKRARQLKTASQIDKWLSSPELRPPA